MSTIVNDLASTTNGVSELVGRIEVLPPRPSHRFLSDFTVTTDSVVAKVHLEMEGPARRIFVDWGDFQTDTLNILPGLIRSATLPGGNPLPEGTYELFHAYDEPEDRGPFDRNILVQIENAAGDIQIRQAPITVTPRYRITQYRSYVRLLKPVDLFGSTGELDVSMIVDGEEVARWYWEPSNNFFSDASFQVLEGSQLARELQSGDSPVNIVFKFRERDFGPDDHGDLGTPMYYFSETETIEKNVDDGGLRNKVRLRVDRDVTLIRPLPNVGNLAAYTNAHL